MYVIKARAITTAIDALVESDEDGVVEVHETGCLAEFGDAWCDCTIRSLLVPPARVADIWWWLRALDRAARKRGRE